MSYDMTMPFPDTPRVIYKKNPLKEVICQLSYPAILRIDSETPAEFQERIRDRFPHFIEGNERTLSIQLPKELIQAIDKLSFTNRSHQFISEDKNWTFILTREFIALTTKSYITWEDFKERLKLPFQAFMDIYEPRFFSRIGLRYKDIIDRKELNLQDKPWSDLLQPSIAGELSDPHIASLIEKCANQLTIKIDDSGSIILLNHGLINKIGDSEQGFSYLIDSDFINSEKTEVKDVTNRLDGFNRFSGKLFRWAITPILHEALEPIDPDSFGVD